MLEQIKEIIIKLETEEYEQKKKQYNSSKTDDILKKSLDNKIVLIKGATDLDDIGINFFDAVELLKENNIPLLLTKKDKDMLSSIEKKTNENDEEQKKRANLTVSEAEKRYTSLDQLVMVHKTDYAPQSDHISTRKENNNKFEQPFTIAGEEYTVEIPFQRDTIHFSINGEVGSHDSGNWETRKYAVLTPFTNVSKENIYSANPEDTYTTGGVALNNKSYILCPQGEGDIIRANNPDTNVIEYEGDNVSDYADLLVSLLGYRVERCGANYWLDHTSEKEYCDLVSANGYKFGAHTWSILAEEETNKYLIDCFVAKMKIIMKQDLFEKHGFNEVFNSLKESCKDGSGRFIYTEAMRNYMYAELAKIGIIVDESTKIDIDDIITDKPRKVKVTKEMYDEIKSEQLLMLDDEDDYEIVDSIDDLPHHI